MIWRISQMFTILIWMLIVTFRILLLLSKNEKNNKFRSERCIVKLIFLTYMCVYLVWSIKYSIQIVRDISGGDRAPAESREIIDLLLCTVAFTYLPISIAMISHTASYTSVGQLFKFGFHNSSKKLVKGNRLSVKPITAGNVTSPLRSKNTGVTETPSSQLSRDRLRDNSVTIPLNEFKLLSMDSQIRTKSFANNQEYSDRCSRDVYMDMPEEREIAQPLTTQVSGRTQRDRQSLYMQGTSEQFNQLRSGSLEVKSYQTQRQLD